LNLLLNAIEAVDEQGTVRLVSRDSGSRVEIDFFNSGSYIEPEQVERIFDPFFTTKEKGTGLGLSITHRIIRQHQGDLRVKSSREDGTCFTVSIPLESSAKALDHWEEDTEPAQSSGA
jgi:signal transduction histidine kinase